MNTLWKRPPRRLSQTLLSLVVAALASCSPAAMTMSCPDREAGVADFVEGEGTEATPALALARFLDSQPVFDQMSRNDTSIGADTVTWSFVDGQGTTVAEVKADRIDGGWAVVKWAYCRA